MATNYVPADGHDDLYTWLFKQTNDREPSGSEENVYVVTKGECLWSIAKKFYGTGAKWKVIFEANADVIRDPNLIYVGQELRIPVLK